MSFDITTTTAVMTFVLETFNSVKEFIPAYRRWKIKTNYNDKVFEEQFIKSIEKNINHINNNDLVEPNLSAIIPTLSESIFYLGEKEIRELFAKLVAASFNGKKTEYIHPGFIGIIKQLSPIDARVLTLVNDSGTNIKFLTAVKNNEEYPIIDCNLTNQEGIDQISLSLENLKRLGIINIDSYTLTKDHVYLGITENYDDDTDEPTEKVKQQISPKLRNQANEQGYEIHDCKAYLTQLGKAFLKVCIE